METNKTGKFKSGINLISKNDYQSVYEYVFIIPLFFSRIYIYFRKRSDKVFFDFECENKIKRYILDIFICK